MRYLLPEDTAVVSQIEALLDRLESTEFDVMVNLASGLQLAVNIAREQPAFRSLVERLKARPSEATRLLSRVNALAKAEIDPRWHSPYEAALLGMLVAAFDVSPSLGVLAARLASGAPEAPWVRRLADSIFTSVPAPAGDAAVEVAGRFDTSQTVVMSLAQGSVPLYPVDGALVQLPGAVRFVTESA